MYESIFGDDIIRHISFDWSFKDSVISSQYMYSGNVILVILNRNCAWWSLRFFAQYYIFKYVAYIVCYVSVMFVLLAGTKQIRLACPAWSSQVKVRSAFVPSICLCVHIAPFREHNKQLSAQQHAWAIAGREPVITLDSIWLDSSIYVYLHMRCGTVNGLFRWNDISRHDHIQALVKTHIQILRILRIAMETADKPTMRYGQARAPASLILFWGNGEIPTVCDYENYLLQKS